MLRTRAGKHLFNFKGSILGPKGRLKDTLKVFSARGFLLFCQKSDDLHQRGAGVHGVHASLPWDRRNSTAQTDYFDVSQKFLNLLTPLEFQMAVSGKHVVFQLLQTPLAEGL